MSSSECPGALDADLDGRGGLSLCRASGFDLGCVTGFLGRYRSLGNGEEGKED
jgi:hypothetical protein